MRVNKAALFSMHMNVPLLTYLKIRYVSKFIVASCSCGSHVIIIIIIIINVKINVM